VVAMVQMLEALVMQGLQTQDLMLVMAVQAAL
jgi:hypothetical protein